ncbi:MAG: SAM-dependent methyltransferase, partial [Solibacillus sp.]
MEFEQMKVQLHALISNKTLLQATISQPRQKSSDLKRVKLKPVEIRGEYMIQLEYQYERILKHENITVEDLAAKLDALFEQFRQVHAEFQEQTVQVQLSKKNKVLWKSDQ